MQINMTKNFCFTANGGKSTFSWEDIVTLFLTAETSQATYAIVGLEGLDDGKTEHWQGFLQTKKAVRFTSFKKVWDPVTKWHWENKHRTASCEQARDYCKKKDGEIAAEDKEVHEWGIFKAGCQGKRTDIHQFAAAIKAGADKMGLIDKFPVQMLKYRANALHMVHDLQEKNVPATRPVKVSIYWGKTDTGKTWKALHTGKKSYMKHCSDIKHSWWDGLTFDTKVLVLDEWAPRLVDLLVLLKITDSYKKEMRVHYGEMWANWEEVIITTNKNWLPLDDPESDIYPRADPKHRAALWRRVKHRVHFTEVWKEPSAAPTEIIEEEKEELSQEPEGLDGIPERPPLVRQFAMIFDPETE